jgi:mannose/fructose/N-acetylgalactosamine-specific phosphotransferase system component IID
MNTTSSAARVRQQRSARIVLISGLAPLLPCGAVLVWLLGYKVHPHKVVFAFVVTGILVVIGIALSLFLYRQNMKRPAE